MAVDKKKKRAEFIMDNRSLSIIVFSLFSSWLLSIAFEGRILYALLNYHRISPQPFVLGSMAAHCAGLALCAFFVKSMRTAKRLMLFSIVFCIGTSGVFFLSTPFLWGTALFLSSFLAGCCVAAWGFFLKEGTPKNERIKTIADMLILSYILTILLGTAATNISPFTGLGLSMFLLAVAFLFALYLPENELAQKSLPSEQQEKPDSIAKPLAFLCLFIVVASLNVGLMFHVQYPAFAHLDGLASWYWAAPYIAVVWLVRNLPRKANRTYILYAAIAMTGFSVIAYIMLDRSTVSYLIMNTLMVGALGIFNLFWWSILGEMVSFHKNPARVLGAGLFANVVGALLGALIGNAQAFGSGQDSNLTLLSLSVVCVTLVMLPPLHGHLIVLLKSHVYLTVLNRMTHQEQTQLLRHFGLENKLTESELKIASLLLTGLTYRMIAVELDVSANTVKTHAKRVYAKVGARNRTELINSFLETQSSITGQQKS